MRKKHRVNGIRTSLAVGLLIASLCQAQDVTIVTGEGPLIEEKPDSPAHHQGRMTDVAVDAEGNVYFLVEGVWDCLIRRLDADTGAITTIAGAAGDMSAGPGGGAKGYAGDGGPAAEARFLGASGIFIDSADNIYIADGGNNRVRKIDAATGIINTVAGNGVQGFDGDGGQATGAQLSMPRDVFVDGAGNIFITDGNNHRIRRVDAATGIINTVAGNGDADFFPGPDDTEFAGDGGPATEASIPNPGGAFVDNAGNLFITGKFRLRKVDTAGNISTLTSPRYWMTSSIVGDRRGNLYISLNGRIQKIDAAGNETTLGPSLANSDAGLFYDQKNDVLYIADSAMDDTDKIYKVDLGPSVELSRIEIDFGSVAEGGESSEKIQLENKKDEIYEAVLSVEGDGVFSVSLAEIAIDGKGTTEIEVRFAPVEEGRFSGSLRIVSKDPSKGEFPIPLAGATVSKPELELATTEFDFGLVYIPDPITGRINLNNVGYGELEATLSVTGDAAFGLSSGAEVRVEPRSSAVIELYFEPTEAGEFSATLMIESNDPLRGKIEIPLSGIREIRAPVLHLSSEEEIDFGELAYSWWLSRTIEITNTGNEDLEVEVSVEGDEAFRGFSQNTLEPGHRQTFQVSFNPTKSGDFTATLKVTSNDPDNSIIHIPLKGSLAGEAGGDPDTGRDDDTLGDNMEVVAGGGILEIIAPADLDMDAGGIFYIATGREIKKVDPSGIITSLVQEEFEIFSLALDGEGNVYYSSGGLVKKRTPAGEITTVAGTQTSGEYRDNMLATEAYLGGLQRHLNLAVDSAGRIYIAGGDEKRVWKVDSSTGVITTAAGDGNNLDTNSGDGGDGGPATQAQVGEVSDVAVDSAGNLYLVGTNRARRVDAATGIITTVAGGAGFVDAIYHSEGPADKIMFDHLEYVSADNAGNIHLIDGSQIFKVDIANNYASFVVAYNPDLEFSGDDGPAREAKLSRPKAVVADAMGDLFIADTGNNRIRRVDATTGIITTVIGGISEDRPATEAGLNHPADVVLDAAGNIYIADTENHQIHKVDGVSGIITTIAGNRIPGRSGDGGPAIQGQLNKPRGITLDATGNIYIADTDNHRIRKVDAATGIITTIAGNSQGRYPSGGFTGDGGPAVQAELKKPYAVAVDGAGNVYIADTWNNRIRKVDSGGTISTIAGSGVSGQSGDGGPATQAQLGQPDDLYIDDEGNIYIADPGNSGDPRVRKVDATGNISTVARLFNWRALGIHGDSAGNIYVTTLLRIDQTSLGSALRVEPSGKIRAIEHFPFAPAGIFFDQNNGQLYIADIAEPMGPLNPTGTGKIVKLDVTEALAIEDDPPGGETMPLPPGEWTSISPPGASPLDLAVDPQRPTRLYMLFNTFGSIARSLDGGKTWEPSLGRKYYSGPDDWHLALGGNSIWVDPIHPQRVYTCVLRSCSWSEGWGRTWDVVSIGELNTGELTGVSSEEKVTLFAEGNPNFTGTPYGEGLGLFRSSVPDSSMFEQIWERISFFPKQQNRMDLFVDPLYPDRLYVATEQGIFFTSDQGEEWTQLDGASTAKVAVNDQRIYSIRPLISGTTGLYRSDDLGKVWHELDPPQERIGLRSLAVNPKNPDIIYLTYYSHPPKSGYWISRSVDGGTTWQNYSVDGLVDVIEFDPVDPSIVYAVVQSTGLDVDGKLLKADFEDPEYTPPPTEDELAAIDDAERGKREEGKWKLDQGVNLGPKAGNGIDGFHLEWDHKRNRAFVGNHFNISVVDFQLNIVTEVIDEEQLGEEFRGPANLAIHEGLDELYVIDGGSSLQILDLKTLQVSRQISLGDEAGQGGGLLLGIRKVRPLVVDEEQNLLYIGNRGSVSAVQLVDAKALAPISLSTDGAVVDLVLSQEEQRLYALVVEQTPEGTVESSVVEIDLSSSEVRNTTELPSGDAPSAEEQVIRYSTRLALDLQRASLYVAGIERVISEEGEETERNIILVPVDLNSNRMGNEISIETSLATAFPQIALDSATETLWVTSGFSRYGGTRTQRNETSKYYPIDLDSFSNRGERPGLVPITVANFKFDVQEGEVLFLSTANVLYRSKQVAAAMEKAIVVGADPQGISVSQSKNLVYIGRGGQGGFFVLDASGNIVSTIEADMTRGIFIDDIADRLFTSEETSAEKPQLGVYELATLDRLYTVPLDADDFKAGILSMKPDFKRGTVWAIPASSPGTLHKLDLSTGKPLGTVAVTEALTDLEIYPDRDVAYLSSRGKIHVFDLTEEQVTETVDASSELAENSFIEKLAIDSQTQRLLGEVFYGAAPGINSMLVVDAVRDTLVDNYPLGNTRLEGTTVFDVERNTAYKAAGAIIELETYTAAQTFTGNFIDYFADPAVEFAHNRITNSLFRVRRGAGVLINLGPAGTEIPPPPAPSKLAIEAGDGEVALSWAPVEDPTFVGYHVYRQDRAGSDFLRITHLPQVATTFTDVDLTNEQTYAYRVSSIGQGALESVPSDSVAATPEGGGNFRLLVLRKSVSVAREDSVSLPMSIESLEGFDEEVTLSAEVPEGLEVAFSAAQFVPPKIVEVRIRAGADAPLGRFVIGLEGEGGDLRNTAEIVAEVTAKVLEESVLTLELDQEEVPLDIPLKLSGRLFPAVETRVRLEFTAERADTLISRTVDTDVEGGYRSEFLAPFTDRWSVSASWAGNDDFEGTQSRAAEFVVTSGKTRITATSDLADDADLGWVATLKGRIYPSPGTVAVTINVRKPDKSEVKIEGVLSNPEGFYGHDLRMDQQGLWEIWTSWKGNDRLLGAASPVITVPVDADVGRVLLVACGQDSPRDIFWPTSNYLANLAYTTFQKRRLLKEKVFYLNDRQDQDVDRDGFMEDVDGTATMVRMGDAWDWVKERVNADNPLFVYLVGKGTPMGLEVSPGEVLTAMQLGEWLDEVESSTGASVTLIVEAAHAGNFIRDLSSQGRKVIGSTGPGLAFYQAEGYLSFSQYFLTDLYQGKSLQEAFLHTHNILRNLPGGFRNQRPGLEAEGNVIANQPGDYLMTMDAFIGAPFELGDLSPQIKAGSLASVAGGAGKRVVTQTAPISEDGLGPRLKLARPVAEEGVEISARIDDAEGNLKVVRAMIIPPESDSLSSLTGYPEVELTDGDGDGTWMGVSHEFLEEGVYPVIIYAIDGAGNAAEPLRTTVLVEPPPQPLIMGDFNNDGVVDFADFFLFADAFGGEDPVYDLDGSGLVDFGDFFLFADAFGGPLGKLLELAEEMLVLPTSYALAMPYPNPFNSEVVVKYSLPRESEVQVAVYNTLGQVVCRLVEGHRGMGHHRVVWDGRDNAGRELATGTYLVQLRSRTFQQVQKIAFVK